ncbi:MAG: hypothetical protein MPJ50_01370 [Pirellulales bacterium]|nr:hypothetical protein [Pirellulales bacterium]
MPRQHRINEIVWRRYLIFVGVGFTCLGLFVLSGLLTNSFPDGNQSLLYVVGVVVFFLFSIGLIVYGSWPAKSILCVHFRGVWRVNGGPEIRHPFPWTETSRQEDQLTAYPRQSRLFLGAAVHLCLSTVLAITAFLEQDPTLGLWLTIFRLGFLALSVVVLGFSISWFRAAQKRVPRLCVNDSFVSVQQLRSEKRIAWADIASIEEYYEKFSAVILVRKDAPAFDPDAPFRTARPHFSLVPNIFGSNVTSFAMFLRDCKKAFDSKSTS